MAARSLHNILILKNYKRIFVVFVFKNSINVIFSHLCKSLVKNGSHFYNEKPTCLKKNFEISI